MSNPLLTRRVHQVLPSKAALQKLLSSGKKLKLYQGFDPTGFRLHLGHSIGLRKLMEFANQGHEVILLFGTGTVLVGDPSQRDSQRKTITQKEINQNIKDWKNQVSPIVDFNKVKVLQNGDWLTQLTLQDIVHIASHISATQLFKRESFQRRLKKGDTVWYHETMYPLLQGYDSVAMDVDLEIGGTDQEFNMLIGRELQKKINRRDKFVLTIPMIMGTNGQPMSKSSGNCIWLNDSAKDMFGKLMSLPDEHIVTYLTHTTDIPLERVGEIDQGLTSGALHPLDAKKELALAVTSQFHNLQKALKAKQAFESTVQAKRPPSKLPSVAPTSSSLTALTLLKEAGLGASNQERKRLILQGGFELDGHKVTNPNQVLDLGSGQVLKFGKRNYKKIIF